MNYLDNIYSVVYTAHMFSLTTSLCGIVFFSIWNLVDCLKVYIRAGTFKFTSSINISGTSSAAYIRIQQTSVTKKTNTFSLFQDSERQGLSALSSHCLSFPLKAAKGNTPRLWQQTQQAQVTSVVKVSLAQHTLHSAWLPISCVSVTGSAEL